MWNFSKKKAAEIPPPKRQKHGNMMSFFAGGEEWEGRDDANEGRPRSAAEEAAAASAALAATQAASDAYKRGLGKRAVEAAASAAEKKAYFASLANATASQRNLAGFSTLELARRSNECHNAALRAPVKGANSSGPKAASPAKINPGRGLIAAILGAQVDEGVGGSGGVGGQAEGDKHSDRGVGLTAVPSNEKAPATKLRRSYSQVERLVSSAPKSPENQATLRPQPAPEVEGSPPSKSESRGAGAEEAPVGKKDVVKKERKVFVVGGKGGGGDEGSRTAQQQQQQQQQQQATPASSHAVTVTLSPLGGGMFKAECLKRQQGSLGAPSPGYHAASVGVFKSMATKKYDAKTCEWSFKIGEHDALVEKLSQLPAVTIRSVLHWDNVETKFPAERARRDSKSGLWTLLPVDYQVKEEGIRAAAAATTTAPTASKATHVDDAVAHVDIIDDGGEESVSSNAVPFAKPKCTYAESCTRENPKHFADESHPPSHPQVKEYVWSAGGMGGLLRSWGWGGAAKRKSPTQCANSATIDEEDEDDLDGIDLDALEAQAVAGGGAVAGAVVAGGGAVAAICARVDSSTDGAGNPEATMPRNTKTMRRQNAGVFGDTLAKGTEGGQPADTNAALAAEVQESKRRAEDMQALLDAERRRAAEAETNLKECEKLMKKAHRKPADKVLADKQQLAQGCVTFWGGEGTSDSVCIEIVDSEDETEEIETRVRQTVAHGSDEKTVRKRRHDIPDR